jgi:hypothetical protein
MQGLVTKPVCKRPLKIPWRMWENNIKVDRKDKRLKDVDWFNLAENRDRSQGAVSTVMNRHIAHNFGNLLTD